ncbi:MAG: hypothetical protein KBF58_02435 [Methyloversatilis sp.]|jgi:hypothetical protein|nr:hypothetical protein [Methyloversatilis sp.]MBP6193966.1 hypothetical protein [Methyloversatilis sp.]MBP9116915.1 hypothetical protein [Methyloversatilis sp.]
MDELTSLEVEALNEALDDEYHAWVAYDQVIADFGEMPPFSNIRDAEARHIDALRAPFLHCGLAIPENRWPGKVTRHESLQAACNAGVAAEFRNGDMYRRLLGMTARPDILIVLHNLQQASQEQHLPAFERCAQGMGKAGSGGRRHRGGRA